MGIAAYKAVWGKSKSKGSERLVMLCLAEHADDSGYCYPSLTTIANETKVSKRQVTRALQNLHDAGEIEYKPGDGRGNYSEFWILLDLRASSCKEKGDTLSQNDDISPPFEGEEKGDISAIKDDILSKRVTSETGKGDMVTPRIIKEPSDNHQEPSVRGTAHPNAPHPATDLEKRQAAHPATWCWLDAGFIWPGYENIQVVIDKIGDSPSLPALRTAKQKWSMSGYRLDNLLGILDWYKNIEADPNWEPRKNYQTSRTTPAPVQLLQEVEPGSGRY